MMALSIRQPWVWLILHAGKDIENRTWRTAYRGRVLIHAAKGMTNWEYNDAAHFSKMAVPNFKALDRGGIVGEVEIVDCVRASDSRWFVGPYGFVLKNPKPLPFRECRGRLGFFEVGAI